MESIGAILSFTVHFTGYYLTGVVLLLAYRFIHVRDCVKKLGLLKALKSLMIVSIIWPYVLYRIIHKSHRKKG